ncbi:MAG TPA: hypothetical protein DDY91_21530 [Planctomycetaceae bacterium]|nr:hypothetical protein [Planctomycetaceae bacterium]
MPIRLRCNACGAVLNVGSKLAGKTVECIECGASLKVPSAAAEPAESGEEAAADRRRALPQREPAAEERAVAAPVVSAGREALQGGDSRAAEGGDSPASTPKKSPQPRPVRAARKKSGRASQSHDDEAPLIKPAEALDWEELVDMTAMVDIVFFLLIFFLVTSMKQIDSTIPMPPPTPPESSQGRGGGPSDLDSNDAAITVRIEANDAIFLDDVEVKDEQDLKLKLSQLRDSAARPDSMLVVGHGDASHGTAVMVLDSGRVSGIEHIKFSIRSEND